MSLRINDEIPNLTVTTDHGEMQLHDYIGDSWGILFSHPKDFTPVCTTEFSAVAKLNDEFNEKISIKKKEFENYLSAETAKVENDINHFKQQALDNISDIASEFSKELIEKITGTKPNDSNLKAIISEISKKQKESKYV